MIKTPSEKLKGSIIIYRKKCQSIIEISDNVRYAGVVNAYGKTLAGIINPKIKPLMKSEIMKNELFIISTLMTLRKEPTGVLGKLDYVLLQHQKVSVLIFQKSNVTYYITIDRKEENMANEIITSIRKII
ncbi:MAG: hypothetical protein OEL84_10545 [Nitrosopumilus sp.]|nr:hypothetical protein [Nitrosopumilus sp.]MDH3341703.1 hypothetical protein [Nitrosopumilus sp.]